MSSTSVNVKDILSGNEGDESDASSSTENEWDEETDVNIQKKLRILTLLQEHKKIKQDAKAMNVKAPTLREFMQARQATVEIENERKRQIEYAQAQMHTMDQIQRSAAKCAFNSKEGLEQAIREQIFPCVVSLIANNGILGTGFFQHSSWLVSNAHVLPSEASVLETEMLNHNNEQHHISFEQSFHRPEDNALAPDIVIINTKSRSSDNNKCLQAKFFTDDPVYKKRVYFYVYDDTETNARTIRYIEPYHTETLPLKFKSLDNFTPPEGCSGAPVLEGRVTISPNPQWQFRVIGTAYARCPESLAIETAQGTTVAIHTTTGQQQKFLCVIPVDSDFDQILKILNMRSTAEHHKRFGDTAAQCKIATSRDFDAESKEYSEQATALAGKYKEGITPLNIQLPPGLEKLLYEYIVKLSKSLLIPKVLQKEITSYDRYPVPALSFKGVQDQFKAFIEFISAQEKIDLVDEDDIFKGLRKQMSESEATRLGIFYFRLDITEERQQGSWKIDIQDNTGLDASGKPLKYQGKSLSSVFSRVYLPLADKAFGKKLSSITGKILGQFLLDSQMGSLRCSASDLHFDQTDKAAVIYINNTEPDNVVENSKYKVIYARYPFAELSPVAETKSRSEDEYVANAGSVQTLYKAINLYDFCSAHLTRQKLIELLQDVRREEEKEIGYIDRDLQAYCSTHCKQHPTFQAIVQLKRDCVAYGKSLVKEHFPNEECPNDTAMVSFLEAHKPSGYEIFLQKRNAYVQAARTFLYNDVFDQYVESLRTNPPGLDTILFIAKRVGFTCQLWNSSTEGFMHADKTILPQETPAKLEMNILVLGDGSFKILENKGPHKPAHTSTTFSLSAIYAQAANGKRQAPKK